MAEEWMELSLDWQKSGEFICCCTRESERKADTFLKEKVNHSLWFPLMYWLIQIFAPDPSKVQRQRKTAYRIMESNFNNFCCFLTTF